VSAPSHSLDAKAGFCPFDHRLRGPDFGLPDGTRGVDIYDDPEFHVDEIVVGEGEDPPTTTRLFWSLGGSG
jgi:hypothetical protein